jgi:hypothetical protein
VQRRYEAENANNQTLGELEQRIRAGRDAWYERGSALQQIRSGRLYEPQYRTFKDYLEAELGLSYKTAWGSIRAYRVEYNLRTCGVSLPHERHAELLAQADVELHVDLARQIVDRKLSVPETRALVHSAMWPRVASRRRRGRRATGRPYTPPSGDPDDAIRAFRHLVVGILNLDVDDLLPVLDDYLDPTDLAELLDLSQDAASVLMRIAGNQS